MVVELKNIGINHEKDLVSFLSNAGNSLDTFRYFSTRKITVLSNHISTILLYENKQPIGYGHLDKDSDVIWLGVCISEYSRGKGYGKLIMDRLIEEARNNNISILKLSVDVENYNAISMYTKYGFINCNEIKQGVMLMELEVNKKENSNSKFK